LNGDETPELLAADSNMACILSYENAGDGSLIWRGCHSSGDTPTGIVVADMDGDGTPDVLVCQQNSPGITIIQGRLLPPSHLDADGDGVPDD
jgi:hypothetical protein